MPKKVTRTFTSCWTCRRRRVRCDGSSPTCTSCARSSLDCDGYDTQLAWVDPGTGGYGRGFRRDMNSHLTWRYHSKYSLTQLEYHVNNPRSDEDDPRQSDPSDYWAFRVFSLSQRPESPRLSLTSSSPFSLPIRVDRSKSLFQHYLHNVSFLMTPIDDDGNPWKTTYPAMAVFGTSKASTGLFHALLAQAAFHLANLNRTQVDAANQYRSDGLLCYGRALTALGSSLASKEGDFTTQIATLLTIAMVDGVYADECQGWTPHFEGGAALIAKGFCNAPWLQSNDAWVIAQSLALGFEIAQSGRPTPMHNGSVFETLLQSVAARSTLGHTIGGSRAIIESLCAIRRLSESPPDHSTDAVKLRALEIIRALEEDEEPMIKSSLAPMALAASPSSLAMPLSSSASSPSLSATALRQPTMISLDQQNYLRQLHRRMFRAATHIHLRRVAFDATPRHVGKFVSAVLADMAQFLELGGGSISIWPVFIAANEAYTHDQRILVEKWFDFSRPLAIQNRAKAETVIRHVWEKRDLVAQHNDRMPCDQPLDWRVVQQELGANLLLL